MVLWRNTKLAQKLYTNNVSEKESFLYLAGIILMFFVQSVSTSPVNNVPALALDINMQAFKVWGIVQLIQLAILWALYLINARGDGNDFLKRLICLSFPVFLQIVVFSLLVIIGVEAWEVSRGEEFKPAYKAFWGLVLPMLYYTVQMIRSFRVAAGHKEPASANAPQDQ